jgi:hypothetical protein
LKIKRIRARNFLSFDSKGIDISDFGGVNSFVGPNNAGKTNLFRIANFIGEGLRYPSPQRPSLPYYHAQNLNEPFEIELSLEFAKEEVEALSDSLTCSHFMDQVNSIPALGISAPAPNIEHFRRFVLDFYGRSVFGPLFEGDFSIILTGGKSESYPSMPWFLVQSQGRELYIHNFGLFTTARETPQGFGTIFPGERVMTDLALKHPEFMNYLKGIASERPAPPLAYRPPNLIQMMFEIAGSPQTAPRGFNSNRLSGVQLEPNYSGTEAFQRLRAFYRSRGVAFATTTVGFFDTIRLIFLSSISFVSDIRGISRPSYLENLELVEFPLHELTYDRLPEVLFKFKNSEFASERNRVKAILKVFSELTDGLTFNVILRTITDSIQQSPTLVAFPKADQPFSYGVSEEESLLGIKSRTGTRTIHELSIEIGSGPGDYPLELSAAGIAEALFLATSIGSTENSVIFLDEPAQKMHPNLQRKILDYVRESARSSHNQFFLITHSPYLIRAEDESHIWRFDLKDSVSKVANVGETLQQLEGNDQARIQVSMKSADIRALLFSKGVVLVEGPSDKLVVEKVDNYLAGLGKSADLSAKEWSIVDVGGKNSLPIFVRLCKILGLAMTAVVDHDALSLFEKTESGKVFAFATDLENAMQTELKGGDRKPLRGLDEIMTQIQNGKLSPELYKLGNFLKQQVA